MAPLWSRQRLEHGTFTYMALANLQLARVLPAHGSLWVLEPTATWRSAPERQCWCQQRPFAATVARRFDWRTWLGHGRGPTADAVVSTISTGGSATVATAVVRIWISCDQLGGPPIVEFAPEPKRGG